MNGFNLLVYGLAAAAAAGGGVLAGYGVIFVFNHMPAKWLCDYDESPDERHLPPRIGKYPWGLLFSVVLATATFKAGYMVSWQYAVAVLPALWSLLIIGIADRKYRIIPDQFVVVLAVTGIGLAVWGQKLMDFNVPEGSGAETVQRLSFLSPILGLLLGGGIFWVVGLIGKAVKKKDIMGFGDVKLMGICGLITGFYGILTVMIMTALSSAVVFAFLMARGKIKGTDEEALGPFIAGSTAVYLIFAGEIMRLMQMYFEIG